MIAKLSSGLSVKEHFSELRSRILRIAIIIIIFIIFCITFGISFYSIKIDSFYTTDNVITFPIIYPDPFNNIAIQTTTFMKLMLLPTGVDLIQTAPGQAFVAQIYVASLIGVISSIPFIIKEFYEFLSPALEKKEKKINKLLKIFIPTVCLFALGIVFSFLIVIPFTLDFLYKYGESIGVETFLNINDFISFVLQFLLGFGIAFELPIIMYIVSLSGIVDYDFWKKNLRYAIIIFIIFGAIITPDGSGVTMWFISAPMILLYISGIFLVRITSRKKYDKKT
ncbi:MAG: twin-arginine translocase subunit TatC [Nitrososphaeraceae archaeon]|nr:twin-arginine translocase subunit TatC [Nitrososphaeraceae archaeon]